MLQRTPIYVVICLTVFASLSGCDGAGYAPPARQRSLQGRSVGTPGPSPGDVESVPPTSAILARYLLNGDAEEELGRAASGRVHGSTPARDRFGRPRSAYYFDGVDDYISIPRSPVLKPLFPVSVTVWVSLDQVKTTMAAFTNDHNTLANSGVFIAFDSNGGNPSFSFGDGNPLGHASRRTRHSNAELLPGFWYHIVGTVDEMGSIKVYVNGVDAGGTMDGSASELVYTQGTVSVGRRTATVGHPPIYFAGSIDDLTIYGIALSPYQVAGLYSRERLGN